MKNSSVRLLSLCVVFCLFLVGCGAADTRAGNVEVSAQNPSSEQESAENVQLKAESEDAEPMLQMKIGETPVTVEWEENESVEALKELCLNAPLPERIDRPPHRPGTLFCIPAVRLSYSMAPIPGLIPGSGKSQTNPQRS